jgi:hypothetical protein
MALRKSKSLTILASCGSYQESIRVHFAAIACHGCDGLLSKSFQ